MRIRQQAKDPTHAVFFRRRGFFELLRGVRATLIVLLILVGDPPCDKVGRPFPLVLGAVVRSCVVSVDKGSAQGTVFRPYGKEAVLVTRDFPVVAPVVVCQAVGVVVVRARF